MAVIISGYSILLTNRPGCHILLAPTVNTQRSPLGGRGFESFSEDPVLNGNIAAAYINGVQSKGVAATIKHFVTNDQEFQRYTCDNHLLEMIDYELFRFSVSSESVINDGTSA